MTSDEEESLLQKVLQVMMEKVVAAFPTWDPVFRPPAPEPVVIEEPYASFPSLPRIRNPRPYEADNVAQPNAGPNAEVQCNKQGYSHGSLSRGKKAINQPFNYSFSYSLILFIIHSLIHSFIYCFLDASSHLYNSL